MRLLEIQIDSFGCLRHFNLELDPGMTILYGSNESGKSTLLAFVEAAFYGFGRYSSDINRNPRIKYTPWSKGGQSMGGCLLFEKNGVRYRLERSFGQRKSEDRTKLWNESRSIPITLKNPHAPGEELLGLTREEFRSIILWPDVGGEVLDGSIEKRVTELVGAGAADVDPQILSERLHRFSRWLTAESNPESVPSLISHLDKKTQLFHNSQSRDQAVWAGLQRRDTLRVRLKQALNEAAYAQNQAVYQEMILKKRELEEELSLFHQKSDGNTSSEPCYEAIQQQSAVSCNGGIPMGQYPVKRATAIELKQITEAEQERKWLAMRLHHLVEERQREILHQQGLRKDYASLQDQLQRLEQDYAEKQESFAQAEGEVREQDSRPTKYRTGIGVGLAIVCLLALTLIGWAEQLTLLPKVFLSTAVVAFGFMAGWTENLRVRQEHQKVLIKKQRRDDLRQEWGELQMKVQQARLLSNHQARQLQQSVDFLNRQDQKIHKTRKELEQQCSFSLALLSPFYPTLTPTENQMDSLLQVLLDASLRPEEPILSAEQQARKDKIQLQLDQVNQELQRRQIELQKAPENIFQSKKSMSQEEYSETILQLREEIATEEAELKMMGQNPLDTASIQQEMQAISKKLEDKKKLLLACQLAEKVVGKCSDKFHTEASPRLKREISSWLSKLTDQRFSEVLLAPNWQVSLRREEESHYHEDTYFSSGLKDVLWFATRLSLSTLYGGDLPLLLDDPLKTMDKQNREKCLEVLQQLGQERHQILLVTPQESLKSEADEMGITVKDFPLPVE